jgi:hypothetical protein
VQWPARLTGGRQIDGLAAHIDVLPTLLEASGAVPFQPARIDGISLLPLLSGKADAHERIVFLQCHRGLTPHPLQNCAAVTQRYKLVGNPGTFSQEEPAAAGEPVLELYDLAADPGETANLADQHPEVLARLKAACQRWFDDVAATRQFQPGVIHVGSAEENPVRLCRYQDATFRGNMPHGWSVKILRAGTYRVTVLGDRTPGGQVLSLAWNGQRQRRSLAADSASATFELPAGPGQLDIWTSAEAGRDGEWNKGFDVDLKLVGEPAVSK